MRTRVPLPAAAQAHQLVLHAAADAALLVLHCSAAAPPAYDPSGSPSCPCAAHLHCQEAVLNSHGCTTASNSALLACHLATWEPAVHALVPPEAIFLQLQVWCSPIHNQG
jgi:hypothetical protein